MQASCASLPSPEWTQPLSTSISGASAQQNGLVSQELKQADAHNAHSRCGGSTPGLFRIWGPGFCSPRGLKHSVSSELTSQTVRAAIIRKTLQSLLFLIREFMVFFDSFLAYLRQSCKLISHTELNSRNCYDSKAGKFVEITYRGLL
jgi:hypothetical protein